MKFVLSWEGHAHTSDVRGVAAWGDHIVTASRDKTVIVWQPIHREDGGCDYTIATTFLGHTGFVNAVATFGTINNGFTVSGSQDRTLRIWKTAQNPPQGEMQSTCVAILEGHEDAVCALAVQSDGSRVVSGSWDKSARVWQTNTWECLFVLAGSEASVWGVTCLPNNNGFATVSADKKLRMFSSNGTLTRTTVIHNDACRSISHSKISQKSNSNSISNSISNSTWNSTSNSNAMDLSEGGEGGRTLLVTCGNDGLVRLWDEETGVMVQSLDEHEGLPVFHVTTARFGKLLISCSEDKNMKIFGVGDDSRSSAFQLLSSLPHPCVIWCGNEMQNGDIVSAGADGVVRVWTSEMKRAAKDEILQRYDLLLSSQTISTQMVGQIDKTKLPGIEALFEAGIRADQRKIVNNNGVVEIYQWVMGDLKWTKIGDVVDTEKAAPKQIDGVAYDYVFDVDVQEGSPPLRLGFNRGEDAWTVAQKFIWKNELEQEYLQQVADFIVRNVGADAVAPSGLLGDPLTGGSRYMPGNRSQSATTSSSTPSLPSAFVGGGAYVSSQAKPKTSQLGSTFFPKRQMTTFATGNFGAMHKKLLEDNAQFVGTGNELTSTEISLLESFVSNVTNNAPNVLSEDHVKIVNKMLAWKIENPVAELDFARLAVLSRDSQNLFSSDLNSDFVWQHILSNTAQNKPAPIRMLSLRFLCNMFAQPTTKQIISQNINTVLGLLSGSHRSPHTNSRGAFVALLQNCCVHSGSSKAFDLETKLSIVRHLTDTLLVESEEAVTLEACVALGTLASDDPLVRESLAAEMPITAKLRSLADSALANNLRMCALDLKKLLLG